MPDRIIPIRPLLDHGVGADAEARVHQDVADVLEPDDPIVQPVLAFAAAEDASPDRDPAVLGLLDAAVGPEREADLGEPQGLALVGSVEDDFLHRAAAQGLGALLAQHPGDGLGQIALAATVRPDDRRDPGREVTHHRLDEGLEAVDFQAFEFEHGLVVSGGAWSFRRRLVASAVLVVSAVLVASTRGCDRRWKEAPSPWRNLAAFAHESQLVVPGHFAFHNM